MIVAMERYVSIKGTKEELRELLDTLEDRMVKGLDAYHWLGNGVTVKFEMTEEVQYKANAPGDETVGGKEELGRDPKAKCVFCGTTEDVGHLSSLIADNVPICVKCKTIREKMKSQGAKRWMIG